MRPSWRRWCSRTSSDGDGTPRAGCGSVRMGFLFPAATVTPSVGRDGGRHLHSLGTACARCWRRRVQSVNPNRTVMDPNRTVGGPKPYSPPTLRFGWRTVSAARVSVRAPSMDRMRSIQVDCGLLNLNRSVQSMDCTLRHPSPYASGGSSIRFASQTVRFACPHCTRRLRDAVRRLGIRARGSPRLF
jgi:hypothetical protein